MSLESRLSEVFVEENLWYNLMIARQQSEPTFGIGKSVHILGITAVNVNAREATMLLIQ